MFILPGFGTGRLTVGISCRPPRVLALSEAAVLACQLDAVLDGPS
jgi:hypothetical protein